MAETTLVLVRHGETVWNIEGRYQGHLDSPLTEVGQKQVKALAERLRGEALAAIYSSDLERCRLTAQPVVDGLGLELLLDKRLRERNVGIFEGLSHAHAQQQHAEAFHAYRHGASDYVIPQGESTVMLLERALSCLEELAQKHAGERIMVVSHGGTISSFLGHVLMIPLDAPRRFRTINAGLNTVMYENGQWMVETLGDVNHLRGLGSGDDTVR